MWLQVSGSQLGVEPVTAAMLAVGCLLATGVLSWADCLAYTAAWDTLIWFTGALHWALAATVDAIYAQPGVTCAVLPTCIMIPCVLGAANSTSAI